MLKPAILRTLLVLGGAAILNLANVSIATAAEVMRLSTTTSTENSGLLGKLLPAFEKETGIHVQVIAVGSGKALELGRNGDVDAVLVHVRDAEERFVAEGYGVKRYDVMFNDFLIIGPASDPAKIQGGKDALAAMRKIATSGARFVSRGDESGTHQKEKTYWKEIGTMPTGRAYVSAGQGMGKVIAMAAELNAYTLTDRATFASFASKDDLKVMVEGDPKLFNPYSVIAVNPKRHPHVHYKEAQRFVEWMTGARGQQSIAEFRSGGQQLFFPSAGGTTMVGQGQ